MSSQPSDPSPLSGLSVVSSSREYLKSMSSKVPGMKALLLDVDTLPIVSLSQSQTELLQQEVLLVETLEATRGRKGAVQMKHLKAVCFVRPSNSSLLALCDELKNPVYAEYHIFFSNTVPHSRLQQLAAVDEKQLVMQVQEMFCDLLPINHDLFSLNLPSFASLSRMEREALGSVEEAAYQRTVEGLFGSVLGCRMNPSIRFSQGSVICRRLAEDLNIKIQQEDPLFRSLPQPDGEQMVLILDRRDDPVTPLLNQWTYQAMLHELFGLSNNLLSAPGVEEQVMSSSHDQFFDTHLHSNFGDIGQAVRDHVASFQSASKAREKLDSIQDMQKFVESYPDFKKLSGNVAKHVAVVYELSRRVHENNLFEVSRVEQGVACSESKSEHRKEVSALLEDPKTPAMEKLRLALLYALRYEDDRVTLSSLKTQLSAAGVSPEQLNLLNLIVSFAGGHVRSGDLFGTKNLISKALKVVEWGLSNVENVYTQHKSQLIGVVEAVMSGKLSETMFPFVEAGGGGKGPKELIVFQAGGTTFEEAKEVRLWNLNNRNRRVILGGTYVHNSRSFLGDVAQLGVKREGRGAE